MSSSISTPDIIDTAAIVIESIWPPLPGSSECPQKQKGLPLRTFIQETLKRSRSSYSTLQTALFYLYKIRNKVPCAYLKRRQDQLYSTHQILSASQSTTGLMTPPASPYHAQNIADFSHMQGSDYFSLRSLSDSKPVLPSPLSSTCSMASASPASGYSPTSSTSSTSPSSTTSSPTSSSGSPCSVSSNSSSTTSTSSSSSSSSSSGQSNRIIYCGRRTFLAALMVASKYLQDRNYSNKAWAKISGLSIKEINANELIFLKLIDYSLFVSHDTFMRWTALLTADAAHASAFAARSLSVPPMVLNGSHIRYGPSKTALVGCAPIPSEKDESADTCGLQSVSETSRNVKLAKMDTYQSSGSHGVVSGESFAF
ncbi:hypothetical protein BGX26_009956 [Mortierella sp. AD094]|nr:hypothetical protein BGX26_009956 [Mortierella sp. AD094]